MKKKYFWKLLLSSATILGVSSSAISCLYEDHPIVIYAKAYSKANPFLTKKRVASKYQNQSLIKFENDLFNKPNLNLFLNGVYYTLQNFFQATNKELEKHLKDIIFVQNNNFIKNDQIITQINNANALKFFNEEFNKLLTMLKEYQSTPEAKSLSTLLSLNYKETEESKKQFNKAEEDIFNLYTSLNNFSFIDISDPNKLVTEKKVREVVSNFLADTPFYGEYLKTISLPVSDSDSMISVSKNAVGDVESVSFEYKSFVAFNAIPYEHFISIAEKIKPQLNASELENSINAYLKIFEYLKTQNFVVSDNSSSGIESGFGPTFILESKDPVGQKAGEYEVFNQDTIINPKNPQGEPLRKEFFKDPLKFFEEHLDLVNYKSIITAKIREKGALNNLENKPKNPVLRAQYQRFKNETNKLESDLNKFIQAFKELREAKTQNASEEVIKQKQALFDKLLPIFEKDINLARENLMRGVDEARTNINHLVELYAYLLFILGDYKVQLIKGTYHYQAEEKPRETYWLEFFDKKTSKWYMADIYQGYLAKKQGSTSQYDPLKELHTSLPQGYTIDPNFAHVAHVK
ncbi:hypothetical protein NPA08_03185 [Mycoplasmopsis citelli]|uniref:hypothetical protein n=1 Tax=Mycoplasmopsis citelli TaxID=171281 RepID=UPI002114E96D|nr:hypothetical protein [Mycoplasmopsis citelli]UUD35936.1 hypothetical protein NPA08_03185 [Mycoplasmopsis citelli]